MENKRDAKWISLASIWFGGIVSVPSLLIGSALIASLNFQNTLLAGFIGFCAVVFLMSLISLIAVKEQKASVPISESSFGTKGSALIVGLVIGISTLGWFAIQTNIAGASFSKILKESAGVDIPSWISSLFWGVVMFLTAVFGFKYLKWLNYVAVPAIVSLLVYAMVVTFRNYGIDDILSYKPQAEMHLLEAIGLVIGFISVSIVVCPDYNRFAASKKDALLGSLMGILPSALSLLAIGAILAITQGTYDIVEIFSSLGYPIFAMTILILATWTSNVMNIYSSGLAFNTILKLKESSRPKTTIIVGLLGLVLAAAGIVDYFLDFITVLTITVTPIAGIVISDYYLAKTFNGETPSAFNWRGIATWALCAAGMLLLDTDTKYILGLLSAVCLYYAFSKLKVLPRVVDQR